jgi:hypothetical protein
VALGGAEASPAFYAATLRLREEDGRRLGLEQAAREALRTSVDGLEETQRLVDAAWAAGAAGESRSVAVERIAGALTRLSVAPSGAIYRLADSQASAVRVVWDALASLSSRPADVLAGAVAFETSLGDVLQAEPDAAAVERVRGVVLGAVGAAGPLSMAQVLSERGAS